MEFRVVVDGEVWLFFVKKFGIWFVPDGSYTIAYVIEKM
jgi:hypothetical protein